MRKKWGIKKTNEGTFIQVDVRIPHARKSGCKTKHTPCVGVHDNVIHQANDDKIITYKTNEGKLQTTTS